MEPNDIQELWNEVCYIINVGSHGEFENIFEEKVLRIVTLLGWKEHRGEIKRKPRIPTGRTNYAEPDIVLYDDNERPCIIIEVKRPSETLNNTSYIDQLLSYMGLFRCDFGILFGKQAHVYYEGDLIQSESPMLIDEIVFDTNNELGHQFIQFLTRESFINHCYKEYVQKRKKIIDKEQNIQKLRRQIVSEETKQRIHDYLVSDFTEEFDEDMVKDVLKNLHIELALPEQVINPPSVIPPPRRPPHNPPSISSGKYSLISLAQQNDLSNIDPYKIKIQNDEIEVRNWTDCDIKFVKWLIDHSFLTKDNLPIRIAARRGRGGKYFINNKPEHHNPQLNGEWKEVSPNFWVNVKYTAKGHICNYKFALEQIKRPQLDITIMIINRYHG